MNKEQIIDEAYEDYGQKIISEDLWMLVAIGWPSTQEEFINKCKTDKEFSEKWGLKIEERELSFNERYEICKEKTNENPLKYSDENGKYPEHIQKPVLKWMESENIPTKLITITYNDTKLESYE